jgi:glucoamylase
MIEYANWLLKNSSVSNVVNNLWPIIKLDLDYVAADWNQTTYVAGISVQLYSE